MSYLSRLECSECGATYSARELHSVCQQCSAPLWVRYDLASARRELDRDRFAGLLSDTYKAVHNGAGFDPYRAYWSTVDQVAITNLSTIADDGRNATILTDLVFYYLDGRVIPINGYEIRLVFDPSRRTWLINETP